MTNLGLMGLLGKETSRVESIHKLHGRIFRALSERKFRKIRGDRMSMIFQEPMTSLNPVYTVGQQIIEVLRLHRSMKKRRKAGIELLGS